MSHFTNFIWEFSNFLSRIHVFRCKFAFLIVLGDKLDRDNLFCLLFIFHLNLIGIVNKQLPDSCVMLTKLWGGWAPSDNYFFQVCQNRVLYLTCRKKTLELRDSKLDVAVSMFIIRGKLGQV